MIPNVGFKEAMSLVPTCVGVVWLVTNDNQKIGCTISSFISVSITTDSEVVAFVLRNESRTAKALSEVEVFQIAILSQRQQEIARIFSSSFSVDQLNDELLDFPSWIDNAVCWFKLTVRETISVNDTVIIMADVNGFVYNMGEEPLIYSSRNYSRTVKLN